MDSADVLAYMQRVAAPWREAARQLYSDPARALIPDPVGAVRGAAGDVHAALYGGSHPDYARAMIAAVLGGSATGMALPEGSPAWRVNPEAHGSLYHGGRERVTAIDPTRLNTRDYGFYGKGFYTALSKDAAKMYGRTISEFRMKPNAKVLRSALSPQKADPGLVDEVATWYAKRGAERAAALGRSAALAGEVEAVRSSPLAWVRAVDEYAVENGYDVIIHSNGEVVVKNLSAVEPVKKSAGVGAAKPSGR